MASQGTNGSGIPAWATDWPRCVADAQRRGFHAARRLYALALQLERDLGLRLEVTVKWSVTKKDVGSPSYLDVILDEATATPEREAYLEALLNEHWPDKMREWVRVARLRTMRKVAAEMVKPRRRLSIDGRDYFVGERDKRPSRLSAPLRERWFWGHVQARLDGDDSKPSPTVLAGPQSPPRRKKLTARLVAVPTHTKRRRKR